MDSRRWELFYKKSFHYQWKWQFLLVKHWFRLDHHVIPWDFWAIHNGKWERSWSVCLPRLLYFIKKIIILMEITSFGRIKHAFTTLNIHWNFLCENLIQHVDKVDNPANLPEVRPIEDFWSRLKAKIHENN